MQNLFLTMCIRCYHIIPYTIMLKRKCCFRESLVKFIVGKDVELIFGDVICCFVCNV